MNNKEIILKTVEFVKSHLEKAEAGHDWWHTLRVWKMAKRLAEQENVNQLVVELSALLHDIADAKFNDGDEEIGPRTANIFLDSLDLEEQLIDEVVQVIRNVSFRGGNFEREYHSQELAVVQDADRLDALGAIGIARTFHYGGFKNRTIYDPEIEPQYGMGKEEYAQHAAPTINHFYEKLLLLTDQMHTKAGRKIAIKRHRMMERFLAQFYEEWDGKA